MITGEHLDEVKTKKFAEVMSNLKVDKALVVIEGENKNVVLSGRNITSTVPIRTLRQKRWQRPLPT